MNNSNKKFLNLQDLVLNNKKVLMRVDFNVPLDEKLHIVDPTRIEAALPTIQYILSHGASLILMSHLGRPKGKENKSFSLAPCAHYLAGRLGVPVIMAKGSIDSETKQQAASLKPGEVMLLENLRFHSAEEKPEIDLSFAQQLATLGELYVNDAFGTAHRKHSSTYTITQYFPQKKAAGFLFEKEIEFLNKIVHTPEAPFYALVGGAKISSKLGILHTLLEKVDALFIGGAMTYTFMAAKRLPIGRSLCEPELIEQALTICTQAEKQGTELLLPIDIVVTTPAHTQRVAQVEQGFKEDEEGMDIGPKTIELYGKKLQNAKTIFWNGPFGKYEEKDFAKGTLALLKYFSNLKATTVIGGGDLVAAATQAHIEKQISHISTGGGASLEYIEKGTLPAIEALTLKFSIYG